MVFKMEFPIFSKYILLAGIVVNFFVFFTCVYQNFIRSGLLVKHSRRNTFMTVCVLLFQIFMITTGFMVCELDMATIWLGIPYFVSSVLFFILYGWFLNQLNDSESFSTDILETIVGVIEAGDPNLEGHSLHVHNLSMLLYDYLPLRYKLKINPNSLKYAALLLDVGKLGIPRSIIQKSGKLTEEEYQLIRRHPEIGVELLKPLINFEHVREWIRCHHERVDGTGYLKLKGEQIPLASRLLAVADTYSAITMERSYRAAISYEEAVVELKMAAGSQLDSELVKIFCNIPLNKIQKCNSSVQKKMKRYEIGDFKW